MDPNTWPNSYLEQGPPHQYWEEVHKLHWGQTVLEQNLTSALKKTPKK